MLICSNKLVRCVRRCHVFNVFAESNQSTSLAATFRKQEGEKCCAYEECVREVERVSFTPLVFSSSGGMPW